MIGPRVLFVRLDSLGDVVLTTPCFEALKRAYPDAQIDTVVQPATAPVLDGHPRVDRVFRVAAPWHARDGSWRAALSMLRELRRQRYDYVLTLRRDLDDALFARLCGGRHTLGFAALRTRPLLTASIRFQAHLHTIENQLNLLGFLGCPPGPAMPSVYCTAGVSSPALHALDGARPKLIGLAPFGSSARKRWPATKVVELLDALAGLPDVSVALLGGAAERGAAVPVLGRTGRPVIDLVGRTTIAELCDVLRRCNLVVSVDSGPMHLAAAVGKPVVALFGREDPRPWRPYGVPHRLLRGFDGRGRPSLADLEPGAVLSAVMQLLRAAAEGRPGGEAPPADGRPEVAA